MGDDHPPAIVREFSEADSEVPILSEPSNTVTHKRGYGESGYRVQVVEHECPACTLQFDRMVRRVDVYPELPHEVRYWCLNPNCAYYLRDTLSHAFHGSYPNRSPTAPAEYEKRDA